MRIKQLARQNEINYHFKLFKSGKFMMTSALATIAVFGGLALSQQTAQADTSADAPGVSISADTGSASNAATANSDEQANDTTAQQSNDTTAETGASSTTADSQVPDVTTSNDVDSQDSNAGNTDTSADIQDSSTNEVSSNKINYNPETNTASTTNDVSDETISNLKSTMKAQYVKTGKSATITRAADETKTVDVSTDPTGEKSTIILTVYIPSSDDGQTPPDADGNEVGSVNTLGTVNTHTVVGNIGQSIKTSALLSTLGYNIDGYDYSDGNIFFQNTSVADKRSVSLKPKTVIHDFIFITRAIKYKLSNDSKLAKGTKLPDTVKETMVFQPITDLSTNITTYTPISPADTYYEQITPTLKGYAANISSEPGRIAMITDQEPTNETITVIYTANAVSGTVDVPVTVGNDTQTKKLPVSGHVGDTVTIESPVIEGYTPDKTNITATINADSTITTTDSLNYSPNTVTADVNLPATVGGKDEPQTISHVTGKTGDSLTLNVPKIAGYTADKDTVTATVNPNGTITTDESVVYSPNSVTADVTIPATVEGKSQPQTVPNVTGKTGDVVTVNVPAIQGYTPDKTTVKATVNADGTITTDESLVYSPNSVTADVTIPATVDGKSQPQTVPNVTGKTGDVVTVNVPTIQGYTSDKTTVKATVNADGTITTDESIAYTPNSVTADVTIPATVDGKSQPQTVPNVTGKTGDVVTVNVPAIQGYTPDKTTVKATVNADGTITTDESLVYSPNSVTANVTISATVDGKSQPQTVPNVTGKTGDKVTVNVPTLDGYTADKKTVSAIVNPDGTITTTDTVVYTANATTPTDNNGGTTPPTDTDTNTVTPPTDGQKPETTDPTDTSTDQTVVTNPVETEKSNSEVVDEPAATPTQVDQPAVHEVTSPSVAVSDKHAANYETDKASKLPQTDEHSAIAASLLGLVSLIGLLGFGKRKRAK